MGEEFNTTGASAGEVPVCSQPSGLMSEGIRAANDEEKDTEITVLYADGGGEERDGKTNVIVTKKDLAWWQERLAVARTQLDQRQRRLEMIRRDAVSFEAGSKRRRLCEGIRVAEKKLQGLEAELARVNS